MMRQAGWGAAIVIAILFVAEQCGDATLEEVRARQAQEQIDSLGTMLRAEAARADAAASRADSLASAAHASDTVLVRVVDSVAVVVAIAGEAAREASASFVVAGDSLADRLVGDPTGLRLLETMRVAHTDEVGAVRSAADAFRVQADAATRDARLWRDAHTAEVEAHEATRSTAAWMAATIKAHEERAGLLEGVISARRRENRLLKLAAAGLIGVAAYDRIKGDG